MTPATVTGVVHILAKVTKRKPELHEIFSQFLVRLMDIDNRQILDSVVEVNLLILPLQ